MDKVMDLVTVTVEYKCGLCGTPGKDTYKTTRVNPIKCPVCKKCGIEIKY